jgi:hypothetical protein
MTLPKWMTTVTPLSKILALLMFIGFPILGFLFGMRYQQIIDISKQTYIQPINTIEPTKVNPTVNVFKNDMKAKLDLTLSSSPLPSIPKENFPKLKVQLPSVGKYCNGCYDAPPGGNSQISENLLVGGQWVTGGFDTPTSSRKWSYVYYVLKGLFPEIPQDSNLVMPEGNFLSDVIKIPVNKLKEYAKSSANYNYKKISEIVNKDGLKIYTFEVRSTFDSDSIGRRDAIFTKDNYTYYIMYDWKEKSFNATFDQIINSISFK